MQRATSRSLVLVDELGTSTDPEEGAALASAVLRHFQRMGVFLVGTTHQRGVARTVQEHPGMVNASVDLDPTTLAPTYQLTVGLPGRSYALTIAARLGLPQEIIEDASAGVSPVEQATETLLRELQQERRTVEQLKEEAESSRLASLKLQKELEEQLASVEATKTELVEEARRELQQRTGGILDRLQRAERAAEAAGRAIQPTGRPAHSVRPELVEGQPGEIREHESALRDVQRELDAANWQPIEIRRAPWQERLKSGDRVYVRGISQPVEVITPPGPTRHSREGGNPAQAQRVEVLLGTMRAKIPVYQLQSLAEGHPAAARQGVYLDRASNRPAAPRRHDPGDGPARPAGGRGRRPRGHRPQRCCPGRRVAAAHNPRQRHRHPPPRHPRVPGGPPAGIHRRRRRRPRRRGGNGGAVAVKCILQSKTRHIG